MSDQPSFHTWCLLLDACLPETVDQEEIDNLKFYIRNKYDRRFENSISFDTFERIFEVIRDIRGIYNE